MGCGASLGRETVSEGLGLASLIKDAHIHPRETRILQIEEVDSYEECDATNEDNFDDELSAETALTEYCHVTEIAGAWVWGISAGGSRNNLEMFQVNPQYLLQIGHEEMYLRKMFSATRRTASVVETYVSLAQLDTKRLLHIAFFIYRTVMPPERLEAEYFLCVNPDECSGTFKNLPVIKGRYLLKAGAYIVIPATFHPYHCSKFHLKVHASRSVSLTLI
ncbi:calpain-2 catalytic subunit-like [Lycorma delicatula]|uniref:calpain-2 catalytic subunit-like n=1 Tax=Lycorma delicatula TaxID=130591 RepID=UPI003F519094